MISPAKKIVERKAWIVQSLFVNNEVWCMQSSILDGHLKIAGMIHPQVRTESIHSNFKKFDVHSTVTSTPQ